MTNDTGHKLPTGITRHVIPGRALRVNLPLSVLIDERQTTEAKNEWLRGWMFTGFPWLALGYSQIDTWLAGYGPLLGVYGVSFALVLRNATMETT